MFNEARLLLSSFDQAFDLRVRRNCEFNFVGKIPTRLSGRIVPCGTHEHLASAVTTTGVVGIIAPPALADSVPTQFGLAISDRPLASAISLHEHIASIPDLLWSSFPSKISPEANVHPSAHVASTDVVVGPGSTVAAGAVILERTVIGASSNIGPGAVLSCDAFEVDGARTPRRIIKQAGGVRIGDCVDIQAKSTIVRATFGGFTEIGHETKIDCQVHVAHDCHIGQGVTITACSELSGRVTVEDGAYIGPNSSIANGLRIGARSTVSIGSVVTRDVLPDERVTGNFAVSHSNWLNFVRSIR